ASASSTPDSISSRSFIGPSTTGPLNVTTPRPCSRRRRSAVPCAYSWRSRVSKRVSSCRRRATRGSAPAAINAARASPADPYASLISRSSTEELSLGLGSARLSQRKSRAAIVPPGSIRSRKPKAGSRPSPVLPPYAQADGIAAAHDGDQDDGAACVLNGARDFVDVAHRAAVDLEDHVATDEPGALGFAARRDF